MINENDILSCYSDSSGYDTECSSYNSEPDEYVTSYDIFHTQDILKYLSEKNKELSKLNNLLHQMNMDAFGEYLKVGFSIELKRVDPERGNPEIKLYFLILRQF